MNRLKRRIDKLENITKRGQKEEVKLIIQEPGETSEQCFKRNGVDPDSSDLNVIIVEFVKSKNHSDSAGIEKRV